MRNILNAYTLIYPIIQTNIEADMDEIPDEIPDKVLYSDLINAFTRSNSIYRIL
jgi:hypothetical protein